MGGINTMAQFTSYFDLPASGSSKTGIVFGIYTWSGALLEVIKELLRRSAVLILHRSSRAPSRRAPAYWRLTFACGFASWPEQKECREALGEPLAEIDDDDVPAFGVVMSRSR